MDSDLPMPMPTPTINPPPALTSFKLLSFDIFGTLIDWESSIIALFEPLVAAIPASSPAHASIAQTFSTARGHPTRLAVAGIFNDHEHALQAEQPTLRYDTLLEEVFLRIGRGWAVDVSAPAIARAARDFGQSIDRWRPYGDTLDAMVRLARHYKLVALSNVDRASFARVDAGPLAPVPFWRIFVAEDIGSYKPDLRNFRYLVERGYGDSRDEEGEERAVRKQEILHVAQSLMHDHVPAREMGMSSCWVCREGSGGGGDARALHEAGKVGYAWRVRTLGELADRVDEAFEREGEQEREQEREREREREGHR